MNIFVHENFLIYGTCKTASEDQDTLELLYIRNGQLMKFSNPWAKYER